MKITVRILPPNLSNHCSPTINLTIKERHQHLLGARQLNALHIQLALYIPGFRMHGVKQPQIENIWGTRKFPKAKFEFAMHQAL